ncbi:MAG: hypothetical protein AAF125_11940 [Chloroflexota bacterium]
MLDPLTVTPDEVFRVATHVLTASMYQVAARRLQREIAGLPPPSHAVALLAQLAATGQPVLAAV